jgi:hypothetical protein
MWESFESVDGVRKDAEIIMRSTDELYFRHGTN